VTRFEGTCSRWVVFIAFVLFTKKFVRDRSRIQWMLAVSADGRYVDSSVAPNPHRHSSYLRKDEAIVFTLA
jgi:hypothetical protein